MKIYKHTFSEFEIGVPFDVVLPLGCRIFDVDFQNASIVMWYSSCAIQGYVGEAPRKFVWVFTGDEVSNIATYIKTLQLTNGLVVHLFGV